jgi:hypothetical protein
MFSSATYMNQSFSRFVVTRRIENERYHSEARTAEGALGQAQANASKSKLGSGSDKRL